MIASVRGEVLHAGLDRVIIEVGGVGLLVHTTPAAATTCRTGTSIQLATTMVVRQDALTLFGFAEADERDMFETVQTISGIGPRLALAMLAVLSPDEVRQAVTGGDLAALVKIPGVGKKSAERLVLELRDKVGMPLGGANSGSTPAPGASSGHPWREQVTEALVGLGWSAKQAADAVDAVAPAPGERVEISTILRNALRVLGR
ncbi:MAG: Holliday junction branch migration protein RuvA [Nostocoides sp.]